MAKKSANPGGDGYIDADRTYTLQGFQTAMGLTPIAFREMVRRGLPVFKSGKRKFVIGRRACEWMAEQQEACSAQATTA